MRDFELEVYFSRWESAARYKLSASDSETTTLAALLAMADGEDLDRWESLKLGYTDPRGAIWLRDAIAAAYDHVSSDGVVCFAGGQEGINAAMHALLGPGDHAIVILPNYQSAETIPEDLCAISGVSLDPADKWSLDIDRVAAAIRPNTRLIAINFPNNPTGKILEQDRFAALVGLCRRHGVWLFSDEVYRLIEREPTRRLPAAVDAYERGISLGALSKSYGLPGLRVGWVACRDPALLQRMERAKHYLSICNSAPCEVLAAIALKSGDRILAGNRRIAAGNLDLLSAFFAVRPDIFEWHPPDGGVVGYPRYKGAEGVEAFCARLIAEAGVLLLPARVYRSALLHTPTDHFRVGFGHCNFAPGLDALRAHLGKPRRESAAPARRIVG